MTEKKSFGIAFIIWLFTGAAGGHKIYIEEKFHYIFWYWALSAVTLGIAPIVSAFRMKKRIAEINEAL